MRNKIRLFGSFECNSSIEVAFSGSLLLIGGVLGFGAQARAATYYMPDDFPDLHTAFPNMTGGDTLIIRDGAYTGVNNVIDANHYPPSGFGGRDTIIKAENEGYVTFDGQNDRSMVYMDTGDSDIFHHVQFIGLRWIHNDSARSHLFAGLNHVKIIRCGFGRTNGEGGSTNFLLRNSQYTLVEECYSWGDGRYAFMT